MFNEVQQMFAGSGGGGPSFKFGNPGDTVQGTIVSMAKVPQTDFSTGKPVLDKNSQPAWQVQIVLQTALRGWQGVSKVPTDLNNQPRNPAEDDGKRAIYAKGVMLYAIGEACKAATGQPFPAEGGNLAVRYTHTQPSPQNPQNTVKHYQAAYQPPPSGAQEVFGAAPQQPQAAPQQPPQGAWGNPGGQPQAPQGWGQQAPQQPQQAPQQGWGQQAPQQAAPIEQGQWGAPMSPQQVAQAGYGQPPAQPQPPQQDPWGAPSTSPAGFGQGQPPF